MIFGWDVGGAHLKVAAVDRHGRLQRVGQVACELWLGLDRLEAALSELAGDPTPHAMHAVTMTGELVDLFPDRCSGVAAILDTFARRVGADRMAVFTGTGFVPVREAGQRWAEVASANWLATTQFVAGCAPEALIIDVGSTTTDVMLVANGQVQAQGRDDHARLASEELVYTGVVRTPVMAIAQRVPFAGRWVGVMAECFATMGDVYRITGDLDPAFDNARTADGRGKSRDESMRRLARMLGCDLGGIMAGDWEALARWLARAQRQLVCGACDRQLSRGLVAANAPVVGLGVGQFLAEGVAADLGREYRSFALLAGAPPEQHRVVEVCGPAFAVARLASLCNRP